LREQEHSLREELSTQSDLLLRLRNAKSEKEQAEAVKAKVDALTFQYEELQGQIRAANPRYAALTQPKPLSVEEVQRQLLDPDTVLLEYSLGDLRSYLWAVTRDSVTSYELPKRAEIEEASRLVYQLLTARQAVDGNGHEAGAAAVVRDDHLKYWSAAERLSQMILAPGAALMGSKRLLIVADGALQYIPFAALPIRSLKSRGPTSLLDQDYVPLIAEHEIINLPSASALAVLRTETSSRHAAPGVVAVFADPVFEATDERVRSNSSNKSVQRKGRSSVSENHITEGVDAFQISTAKSSTEDIVTRVLRDIASERDGISRLPFSRSEAQGILRMVPRSASLEALDFKASQTAVTSTDLSRYRIVHFATHALVDAVHPELSGIVLSLVDERGRPQRGFLQLQDIYNLNVPADLVVLSACQTGLGKEIKGEGLVGLTRGFMYAGAKRVVASLWNVNDHATSEFMKQFYGRMLGEKLRPAEALRATQIEMWRTKQWHAPYYWAPFIVQGEWK
jgi:CHAT domain-containing protein